MTPDEHRQHIARAVFLALEAAPVEVRDALGDELASYARAYPDAWLGAFSRARVGLLAALLLAVVHGAGCHGPTCHTSGGRMPCEHETRLRAPGRT
jgi:hypothetical protein